MYLGQKTLVRYLTDFTKISNSLKSLILSAFQKIGKAKIWAFVRATNILYYTKFSAAQGDVSMSIGYVRKVDTITGKTDYVLAVNYLLMPQNDII